LYLYIYDNIVITYWYKTLLQVEQFSSYIIAILFSMSALFISYVRLLSK